MPIQASSQQFDTRSAHYQQLKGRIHQELLNRLNLERLTRTKRDEAEPELRNVINTIIQTEMQSTPLSLYERENLVNDVLNELFGLGPLEGLLSDPDISDILVNRYDQVYIERNGLLEETAVNMMSNQGLTVLEIGDSEHSQEWLDAALKFADQMRGGMVPADIFDRAKAKRDEFRSQNAE